MTWFLDTGNRQKHWSWRAGMFTDEQLNSIVNLSDQLPAESASVVGHRNQIVDNSNIRSSNIRWIPSISEHAWIYNTLAWNVETVNRDSFHYELTHIETLQLTTYTAETKGFYGPHLDHGEVIAAHRKLTFVLQLSDPNDYQGGELVLHIGPEPTILPKERGKLLFFPSFTLHEVRPVTQGIRHSLVGWVAGPKFK